MAVPVSKDFDFIIAGAGCAGLSLAVHLIHSGGFRDKRILLIDRDAKAANDRTWCFWEKEAGLFEPVVHRQWEQLHFYGEQYSARLDIHPYRYKMIRGADFYRYALDLIRRQPNFTIWRAQVSHVFSNRKATGIITGGRAYLCDYVFNSILFGKPRLRPRHTWLLQHFKGWVVETDAPVFDAASATLMDFRVDQSQGTAFCYVLPLAPDRALVEYTLFSAQTLAPGQYDQGLRDYLSRFLNIDSYRVAEEEFGIIPMTDYPFPRRQHHLIHLGTAGGRTKGSSGYTFRFIQKHSARLVQQLLRNGKPFVGSDAGRFAFYDRVLLRVLKDGKVPGREIFTRLFEKNDTRSILRFLDNESTLPEELKLISTLPVKPFLAAAMGR